MTVPATFSFDSPGDAARAAELRRVKALATLVLAGTLTLFVTAKLLVPLHPVFGFVAAFAEAATIGGLADWYAVVALFKRPLGLPIPHTAIIQGNQHRIAVGGQEYFIDLLLFHRRLRCLVAIDLKIGAFQPEHKGKMEFYLEALDAQERMDGENPPIGIIICRDKNVTVVEYALRTAGRPIGVATYAIVPQLPEAYRGQLPSPEEIALRLRFWEREGAKDGE